ncbi:hypothetical protein AMATHDRAFT_40879 [Amanita thiersii Skay4041]|uniref:RING-type domain-containing protein n=1 Tax=Amanita thiersii Skay4041 TaxID=703135 RepID=A0A2A9NM78_9AGAR|nr:hypothetical protein AMATHDRAFT_40879 [Amanita thiersii Skay4041]
MVIRSVTIVVYPESRPINVPKKWNAMSAPRVVMIQRSVLVALLHAPCTKQHGESAQAEEDQTLQALKAAEIQARREEKRRIKQSQLEAESRAKQKDITEKEARVTIQHAVHSQSVLVTCGAGIDIRQMVCGFDCCYVTIKNLPPDMKGSEIEELVDSTGVDHESFLLLDVRHAQSGGHGVEAKIILDANYARRVALTLDGSVQDGNILEVEVSDNLNAVGNRLGSSDQNPNVLTISWHPPSRAMVASFSTPSSAQNAVTIFNRTTLHGQLINVELDRGRSRNIPIDATTSVKIYNLPLTMTLADVKKYFNAVYIHELRPPLTTPKAVHSMVRQRIENLGGFCAYEIAPANAGRSKEVRVTYNSPEAAKRARDMLKDRKFGVGFPTFKFWIPEPAQCTLMIPLQQYQAQQAHWDSIADRYNKKAAFVQITDNGTGGVSIQVSGEDTKAVGQLKLRVENLVVGEALDASLWHQSFTKTAMQRFFEIIYTRTQAYIRHDGETQSLTLYATGTARKKALILIRKVTDCLESRERTIQLPESSIPFFKRQGLSALKEELGDEAVTLDLDTVPGVLKFHGGDKTRRMVNVLIEESLKESQIGTIHEAHTTCPICFDEVKMPFTLGCGHTFCTACISHYLTSATERKRFPLVCVGNGDSCKTPIPIPTIERYLSLQQLAQLIEAAVTTYIDKQPNRFRYCITLDCPQVYCCEGSKKILTCPACFATVCTGCHREAHDGMTCAEREQLINLEEQEQLNGAWARTAGAKRCPACQVWIQKIEGCNHMTCHCGAHICWICLAQFTSSSDVYTHLRKTHGGIYDHEINARGGGQNRNAINNEFLLAQRLQREEDERARRDILGLLPFQNRPEAAAYNDALENFRPQRANRIVRIRRRIGNVGCYIV